jgi:hypothetical protein
MKTTNQKPAVSKLLAQFDIQLKEMITADLKMIRRAQMKFLNVITHDQLSVA